MNKIRVFDVGNEVMTIVEEKKPSNLVPFKGNFPLLSLALRDEYYKYVASSKTLDEVPVWVQDIINNGLKIKAIDDVLHPNRNIVKGFTTSNVFVIFVTQC